MDNIDQQKQKLIQSLLENPTSYEIEVLDNSMLPTSLIDEQTLTITVRPPTLETLAKCAEIAFKIPKEVREADPKNINFEDSIKYAKEISETLAILSSENNTDHEWMPEFIMKNLKANELYYIFYESMLKLQTDFFLKSIQIAGQSNPMMMMSQTNKKDSIPTDS